MEEVYEHDEPFDSLMLPVDETHTLSITQFGSKTGLPAVFLHGGPGGSTSAESARFFDPARYRVVLMDQRGAGKSTPRNELKNNTSWHLVDDIEKIREHLGIDQWHLVFGGSWGSTLALLYSQSHPDKVRNIILRGVTTMTRSEMNWTHQTDTGAARLFPDDDRDNPSRGYYEILTKEDDDFKELAAHEFNKKDLRLIALYGEEPDWDKLDDKEWSFTHALLETHYFSHQAWLEEGQLLKNVDKLAGINGIIVQGANDHITPPWTAYQLYQAWPNSQLFLIQEAGHSAAEPAIERKLIQACDEVAGNRRNS